MHKVYRIRGTAGCDRIYYDGHTKANTAALSTFKILLQSVVSDDVDWTTLDIKDFYLITPLPRPEYIRIPLKFLSPKIIAQHSLQSFVHNNSILFEVTKSMYGLPHAGKIAQDVLIGRLAMCGYLQTGTTCIFRHVTNGVVFTLVVDDFAVKFKDFASADHLIICLELHYNITIKKNATKSPTPALPDTSPLLTFEEHHRLQQIGGVLLYYCLAVDSTGLPAVTAIESALSHVTQLTQQVADRLLSYFRHYPDNIVVCIKSM